MTTDGNNPMKRTQERSNNLRLDLSLNCSSEEERCREAFESRHKSKNHRELVFKIFIKVSGRLEMDGIIVGLLMAVNDVGLITLI
nr:hypothetical protein [Tanacetum cinerariifolium]